MNDTNQLAKINLHVKIILLIIIKYNKHGENGNILN